MFHYVSSVSFTNHHFSGPPKAVMISHDNVTWQSRSAMETMQSLKKDGSPHSTVSYLPLSHIAGQLLDIFYPMAFTANYPACKEWIMHYARPTALKGTLGITLKYARPTLFFGVPRCVSTGFLSVYSVFDLFSFYFSTFSDIEYGRRSRKELSKKHVQLHHRQRKRC